jgi:flagellar basal body rod protein FlgG
MVDAGRRLDTGAHNIANASTEPFSPLQPDGSQGAPGSMDLVDEMVNTTILAPAAYAANARVVRAADETRGALLDIRA